MCEHQGTKNIKISTCPAYQVYGKINKNALQSEVSTCQGDWAS